MPSIVPGLDIAASFRFSREDVQSLLDRVSASCFALLPATTVPPSPPPPPPLPPVTRDCSRRCGSKPGQTCKDFRRTSCSLLRRKPLSCSCGDCCGFESASPLPPPPPSPPHSPSPTTPVSLTCSKPCAGTTCGAFAPYSCVDLEALGEAPRLPPHAPCVLTLRVHATSFAHTCGPAKSASMVVD